MKYASSVVPLLLIPLICIAGVPFTEISRDRILSAGPEWRQNYDEFHPAPESLEALKAKLGDDVRIDTYLGLWCSDSRNNVPPFLKILDQLGMPVHARYFNVQRKPVSQIQYFVDAVKVERVPTFIFYRGGIEIGRIVENPKTSLITDMMEILLK